MASVLTLAGMAAVPARKAADEILALETRLAEASLAPAAAADPAATAHKLTFAQLSRLARASTGSATSRRPGSRGSMSTSPSPRSSSD